MSQSKFLNETKILNETKPKLSLEERVKIKLSNETKQKISLDERLEIKMTQIKIKQLEDLKKSKEEKKKPQEQKQQEQKQQEQKQLDDSKILFDSDDDDDDSLITIVHVLDAKYHTTLTTEKLIKFIYEKKQGYEVLLGKVIPFYDYEKKYDSLKEQQDNNNNDFDTAHKIIMDTYKKIYPDIIIYSFDASGLDLKGRFKNSFHFRLRNCGYLNQGSDCITLKILNDSFDNSVYKVKGSRQLLRLPLCSKEGENRPLLVRNEPKQIIFNDDWLVSYINRENHVCKIKEQIIEKKIIVKKKITDIYTVEDIEGLMECINYEEQNYEWQDWAKIIWGLRNMADDYNIDLRHIAHTISICNKKYDELYTDSMYDAKDKNPPNNPIGVGTFIKMAKEIKPQLYMGWKMNKSKSKPKINTDKNVESLNINKLIDINELIGTDDITTQPLETLEILDEDDISNGVNSDIEASLKMYKCYPYWKYCLEMLYVFDFDTGLWTNSKAIQRNIIKQYSKDLRIIITTADSQFLSNKSYGSSLSKIDIVIELIKCECSDNQWLIRSELSSLGKLLFTNGYLDLKNNLKFYDKKTYKFNPDIVFFERILKEFNTDADLSILSEYSNDIRTRFFYNVLGEKLGDYYILQLSRGLMGDLMKRILFSLGDTNTGKSVLSYAIKKSLEGYFGDFNAENLVFSKNSCDEAAKLRWALLLRYKRIIVSNEMKSDTMINGNMIKKISSGGDSLTGRYHCGNETPFTPHFLTICMSNDLPKISPYDNAVDNRLKVISYKKQFVDNVVDEEYELKKDYNITDEINKIEFQNSFLMLLINRYVEFKNNGDIVEPIEVKNGKKEWIESTGDVIDTFLEDYEITDNVDDYTTSEQITSWIQNKKLGITMMKLSLELKKHCKNKKYENVESKQKKINRRAVHVWVGIKDSTLDY